MLATLTTMARWADDMMKAIDANDGGGQWGMATTLVFPRITLFLLVTTSTDVASGSSVANITHYATERSQVAAEAAEGAWTPNNQDPIDADEAGHLNLEDHICLTLALKASLLNHESWCNVRSTFHLLATEPATAARLTVDGATLGTADHSAAALLTHPVKPWLGRLNLGKRKQMLWEIQWWDQQ